MISSGQSKICAKTVGASNMSPAGAIAARSINSQLARVIGAVLCDPLIEHGQTRSWPLTVTKLDARLSRKRVLMNIIWRFTITIVLAAATLSVSLRAAYLWRKASHVEAVRRPRQSVDDAPSAHILAAQLAIVKIEAAAHISHFAAVWTAWAAVLGALTSVWGGLSQFM